jgi:CubicO group peptidase (beta-lactamase class C family)
VTIDRTPPPTAAESGLMIGTPPTPGRRVTLRNWISAPFNRWALQHFQELVPCSPILRSDRVWTLPRDERGLGRLEMSFDGQVWRLEELADALATDGLIVLHRGVVVYERYANAMTPATRHLCFSLTKSVVATIAGILVGRGVLDPDSFVTEVIPELAGTSWDGATVRHTLDMRTGSAFDEVYDEPEGDAATFGQVLGWFPRTDQTVPADTFEYLATMPANREHGGAFDYQSPVTSMVGWLCERAGGDRLASLIARELWSPMGAEFDASLAVDAVGNGFGGGGLNASLRDIARFGELWRLGGRAPGGTQIIPADWVADTLVGGTDSRWAIEASAEFEPDPERPRAFYRNKWWIEEPDPARFIAIGIYGQWITVDTAAELVVARFSSRPIADDEGDEDVQRAIVRSLGEALNG